MFDSSSFSPRCRRAHLGVTLASTRSFGVSSFRKLIGLGYQFDRLLQRRFWWKLPVSNSDSGRDEKLEHFTEAGSRHTLKKLNISTFQYTAKAGYKGPDSFAVTATGKGPTASGTSVITMNATVQ